MHEPTDGGGSESVFRLIYRSHSLIPGEQRKAQLAAIFNTARANNRSVGVTGALMISDEAFVQVLEGGESVVRDLFARIAADQRHEDLTVLEEHAASRTFGRWAMAKVASDDGPDIRLLSNARSPGIVVAPGRDQSITPEQETVLASMRAALARDTTST